MENMGIEDYEILEEMLKNSTTSITWVLVGDSVTHGARHTHGQRSYPEHFAERVRSELKRYTDIIINTGITNDTTNVLLKTWDARVARFKPDVVSVMEGMNDSYAGVITSVIKGMNDCDEVIDKEKFVRNLHEIIGRIRQISAIPLLHTMSTIDLNSDMQRKNLPMYVEAIRTVAQAEKVILVDNYKHWKANPDSLKWLNDAIHPNGIGHCVIANELLRTMNIFDTESPTCRNETNR